MNPSLFPTKGNLLLLQHSVGQAKLGYELMDRKRNVMIMEMMQLIDKAKQIQSEIDQTFSRAYACLQDANISLGIEDVADIAQCIPVKHDLDIRFRSVMGVELPSVSAPEGKPEILYGFENSDSRLDEAVLSFLQVRRLINLLAEVENSVYRLAVNIKKTQKRANALSDIIIPRYTESIRSISESLEEKEREEFTRLKVIKKQKIRKE